LKILKISGCIKPPLTGNYFWDYHNYSAIEDVRRNIGLALASVPGGIVKPPPFPGTSNRTSKDSQD
jgi:hypothetical protein